MNKFRSIRTPWWILPGIGLFWISASFSFRFARDEWIRITHSRRRLEQLQSMVRSTGGQRAGLTSLATGEATPPGRLLRESPIKGELAFGDPSVRRLSDGVRHQQISLELNGVDPEGLHELLRIVENARPPWRVTRMELETHEDGLRGALRLEALDKPASMP